MNIVAWLNFIKTHTSICNYNAYMHTHTLTYTHTLTTTHKQNPNSFLSVFFRIFQFLIHPIFLTA